MQHLALQWLDRQPGVSRILFGARNRTQVEANKDALSEQSGTETLAAMTEISDQLHSVLPPETNMFRWYP
jgi:aryl-alcohol dehydrogenase-like predicted oxidoreductase